MIPFEMGNLVKIVDPENAFRGLKAIVILSSDNCSMIEISTESDVRWDRPREISFTIPNKGIEKCRR
jgi:hypothetical protein